ncbi:MAG: aminotransferase class III-fold pyridoxal phosphate-dependent enzyme [Gammaproteobacteria bacterium]
MANKVAFNKALPDITNSQALWARSVGLIPAGTQTLAKGPTQFSEGVAPKYLLRGRGARVWDVDGNEYLDFNMGVGPLVLGYCHPEVNAAIRSQLEDGITFSLMHPLEVELAELIRECVPNAQSVRFSKTGCDVTSAAVRLARAYTGREKVLCCGYHGWHDWHIVVTGRNAGVPGFNAHLTKTFAYNDIDSVLATIDADTACVILEPFAFERERNGFLSTLREVCDKFGALLVFDEMWTGFRCALGGAQEFTGVRSDLSVFSKAMANGMPISAITGRSEVMSLLDQKVFFFTTFGGEALSLAASIACINAIRRDGVIAHLASIGQRLVDGLHRLIEGSQIDFVSISGYPFRTLMNFKPQSADPLELKTLVQQELLRWGILWSGVHNICYAHSEQDIDYTLQAFAEVFESLKCAVLSGTVRESLRGEVVQPVFRRVG